MTFFEALHAHELPLIQALQTIRTPWLDAFMFCLQFFDSIAFYVLLIPVIWYGYNQRCGKLFLALSALTLALNVDLKDLFSQPRPCVLLPELCLGHATSYGFPSGAAQGWTILVGFLCLTIRKTWFTVASLLALVLVCFSRVYLGVHFPSDIVGGLIFGLGVLTLFWYLSPPIEHFLLTSSKLTQLLISLLAVFILAGFSIQTLVYSNPFLILWVGGTIGLIWGKPLPPPTSFMQRLSRVALAIAGIIIIHLITDHTPLYSPATFLLSGLWISFGVPAVLSRT